MKIILFLVLCAVSILSPGVTCAADTSSPAIAAPTKPSAPVAPTVAAPASVSAVPSSTSAPVAPTSASAAPAPQAAPDQGQTSDGGLLGGLSKIFSHKNEASSPRAEAPGRGRADPNLPPKMNVDRKADGKNLELAQEIVKLLGPVAADRREERVLRRPMMTITNALIPTILAENSGQEAKVQKIAADVLAKIEAKHAVDDADDRALAYAQVFTTAELGQIKAFYESAAGKKLIQSGEDLEVHEMQLMQDSAIAKAYDARDAILADLKKNGIKIPKGTAP